MGGQQRGGPRGRGQKRKREMGRGEWSRKSENKRARHEENQKGEKELPVYATKFSAEEIAAQERKPKRKVAVMIGYSGTGYKGMQLNHHEKTIEGDLFQAFVKAGAISKANADDPKKSSLVRCARTDKGVHAAGNVISLKLVIEDPDVVTKINEALPAQIRVWGIERTNSSFSAYQLCDSRIYEYLIPTYCFLPPHPETFLGKKIVELAEREDDLQGLRDRQAEVDTFWSNAYEKYLNPIIATIDPSIKDEVLKRWLHLGHFEGPEMIPANEATEMKPSEDIRNEHSASDVPTQETLTDVKGLRHTISNDSKPPDKSSIEVEDKAEKFENEDINNDKATSSKPQTTSLDRIDQHVRSLKMALATAKRAWRIPEKRLDRVRSLFSRYVGSIKYHNFTVDKTWSDASAMRVIKSFKVSDPIIIGNTEWLSLKVHGQSFMMHQIRKMVSAAALIVRCGCHEGRIQDTFMEERISIPKAPSLGLLLEQPVFEKYNAKLIEFGREPIEFGRYEKEMSEFKQRQIYERIYRDEEKENIFLAFFSALDSTRSSSLLWLTSAGLQGIQTDLGNQAPGVVDAENQIARVEEDDSDVPEDS